MISGHKIEKIIKIEDYLDIVNSIKEKDINVTKHTFFRLKEKDRKIFKSRVIKDFILSQKPILVGLQYNGNHAIFYKYGKETLKIIIDIQPNYIDLITFYIIDNKQVPRIKNER